MLINSEQGMKLFKEIENILILKRPESKTVCPLDRPIPKIKRDQFGLDFKNKNFTYIAKVYGGISRKKHTIKAILRAVKRKFGKTHTKRK